MFLPVMRDAHQAPFSAVYSEKNCMLFCMQQDPVLFALAMRLTESFLQCLPYVILYENTRKTLFCLIIVYLRELQFLFHIRTGISIADLYNMVFLWHQKL